MFLTQVNSECVELLVYYVKINSDIINVQILQF